MIAPWGLAALVATLVIGTASAQARAVGGDRAATVRGRLGGVGVVGCEPPPWFGRVLSHAELAVDTRRWWPVARLAALGVGGVVVVAQPLLGVGAVIAGAVSALAAPAWAGRRSRVAFEAALPGVVELVAGRLAAGASLSQALGAATAGGPVEADLARVGARQARGLGAQEAVDRWADERPATGVGLIADALALAGGSGGSQAEALIGVAGTLRERQALAREVRALGSQARASAVVLVVTPVAFAAVVALVDPRIRHIVVATPLGWACVTAGLALDAAAAWWMQRLLEAAS